MLVHVFMNESMSDVSIYTVNVSRYIYSLVTDTHGRASVTHGRLCQQEMMAVVLSHPGSVSDYVFYSILTCGSV